MNFRFCIPKVIGRGAGLGNELVPWCRSFLAAQLLGAHSVAPAFGLNPRRYGRHFGTPAWDWLAHRMAVRVLPTLEFTEQDYLDHGGGDVVSALRAFAEQKALFERQVFVLQTAGMWGGMHHIEAAREHARSLLYLSRFAARNLLALRARLDPALPVVAMHVRFGDFGAPLDPGQYRGRFNASLPLSWYRRVAESIHRQCRGDVQFLIVSDAPPSSLGSLTTGLPCVSSAGLADSDCSDLLALAQADLLVCSISSYSVWAAFLSDAPYLWYGPNLHEHVEGCLSIWGHEPSQLRPSSPTHAAVAAWRIGTAQRPRGWPIGADGDVPTTALAALNDRRSGRGSDLVRYGVVPAGGIRAVAPSEPMQAQAR